MNTDKRFDKQDRLVYVYKATKDFVREKNGVPVPEGSVVYVGLGSRIRIKQFMGAAKQELLNYWKQDLISPEIIESGLWREEAQILERTLWEKHKESGLLFNVKAPEISRDESELIEILTTRFEITEDHLCGLKYKVDVNGGRGIKAGDFAGSLKTNGYFNVQVGENKILNHRIVMMLLHSKPVPKGLNVLHINESLVDFNGVLAKDCRLSNLVLGTQSDNVKQSKRNFLPSTGEKYISLRESRKHFQINFPKEVGSGTQKACFGFDGLSGKSKGVSKESALNSAIDYRNKILQEHGLQIPEKGE